MDRRSDGAEGSDNGENPYADNLSKDEPDPTSNARDQSVFAEPWMTKTEFHCDEYSDAMQPTPRPTDVDHTVWDEPGLSPQLAGDTPDDGLTWARWYERESAATSVLDSWLVTILLCVLSGPLAIVTAAFGFQGSTFDIVLILLVVPAVEELLKVLLPLWVVERKPYLFIAPFQIMLCAGCSGLVFGAVHHLFAMRLFRVGQISSSSTVLAVSMVAQLVCSLVAGMALVRIWSRATRERRRPNLTDGGPLATAAIALHIAYAVVNVVLQMF